MSVCHHYARQVRHHFQLPWARSQRSGPIRSAANRITSVVTTNDHVKRLVFSRVVKSCEPMVKTSVRGLCEVDHDRPSMCPDQDCLVSVEMLCFQEAASTFRASKAALQLIDHVYNSPTHQNEQLMRSRTAQRRRSTKKK